MFSSHIFKAKSDFQIYPKTITKNCTHTLRWNEKNSELTQNHAIYCRQGLDYTDCIANWGIPTKRSVLVWN